MKSAPVIAFDYRPPRTVLVATALVAIAAAAAPWQSAAPLSARVALTSIVAMVGLVALRRFSRADWRRIAFAAAGWRLSGVAGEPQPADLASHRRVGAWIVLDFRLDGGRRFRALLGPGNLDVETRRRLTLLLARAEVAHAG